MVGGAVVGGALVGVRWWVQGQVLWFPRNSEVVSLYTIEDCVEGLVQALT